MSDIFIVIGILLFLVLITMLLSHSHTLQRFALLEMLLIAAVGMCTFFSLTKAQEFMKEQYFSMFCLYIDDARVLAGQMENEKVEASDTIWQKRGDDLQRVLDYSLPVSDIDGEKLCYLTAAIYERNAGGVYFEKAFRQTKSSMTNADILNYVTETGEKAIRLGTVMCEETTGNSAVLIYAAEDILSPAYIFATEIPLEPLTVKFDGMLDEYIRYLSLELAGQNVKICLINLCKSAPVCKIDVKSCKRVFMNLINNSVKYKKPDIPCEIVITLDTDKNGNLLFAFADNGTGVEEGTQEKLFEMFYRADGSRHNVKDGNGVGLFVSAEIIKSFNGKIWEENNGNGLTVFVSLPLTQESAVRWF